MDEMKKETVTIISLGAGVQSSAMFLMSCLDVLPKADLAIFADTGAEPKAVYKHLDYLIEQGKKHGIPVRVVNNGNLEKTLLENQDVKRYVTIPYHIRKKSGDAALGRRQCTSEYKLIPIRRASRAFMEENGAKRIRQLIGISADEIKRMRESGVKYIENIYPLIDKRMTRQDCLAWMRDNNFPEPPRSACVFCPFHSNRGWQEIEKDPDAWARALTVDEKIRHMRDLKGVGYLHKSLFPLVDVDLSEESEDQLNLFENECEGMCGT